MPSWKIAASGCKGEFGDEFLVFFVFFDVKISYLCIENFETCQTS